MSSLLKVRCIDKESFLLSFGLFSMSTIMYMDLIKSLLVVLMSLFCF